MAVNPFRYTNPVGPHDLIDREQAASRLTSRAESGNNSRLVAPRRFGKTSLLRAVATDMAADGWATVYVDFFGVLTLDAIAKRIERAYSEQLQGGLATWFAGFRQVLSGAHLGGGPVPASIDVRIPSAEAALNERLDLPVRIHERSGRRVLVVFDEFSEVLRAAGNADAVIRSVIQHHGDAASYIFAGSAVGMMTDLFSSPRRAFYAQASPVHLPPLPPELAAAFIGERFNATGKEAGAAMDPLLRIANGHPQRSMLMAAKLWDRTRPGRPADLSTFVEAYQDAMADVRDELEAIWQGLTTGDQRVLTALADPSAPVYTTVASLGGSRGGAVQGSLDQLMRRGIVLRDRSHSNRPSIVDPLLSTWVREGLQPEPAALDAVE